MEQSEWALDCLRCDAMNRDIMNVLFGGLNNAPAAKGGRTQQDE